MKPDKTPPLKDRTVYLFLHLIKTIVTHFWHCFTLFPYHSVMELYRPMTLWITNKTISIVISARTRSTLVNFLHWHSGMMIRCIVHISGIRWRSWFSCHHVCVMWVRHVVVRIGIRCPWRKSQCHWKIWIVHCGWWQLWIVRLWWCYNKDKD